MKNTRPLVSVIMGSDSDFEKAKSAIDCLREFNVPCEVKVLSAHRTPQQVIQYALSAEKRGIKIIIALAGGAAHLGGVIASSTHIPVIGVPLASSDLHGLDALLAMVQMPAGVPVGTVAIGASGAVNAALFAIEILALHDKTMREKIIEYRKLLVSKVTHADERVQQLLEQQ